MISTSGVISGRLLSLGFKILERQVKTLITTALMHYLRTGAVNFETQKTKNLNI